VSFLRVEADPATAVAQLSDWLAGPSDVRLVVETSGSSGAPKRVVLSQAAVRSSVAASAARVGSTGRWALVLPPSYVAGVQVICRSLVAGFEPVHSLEEDFEFVSLVPTQLRRALADPGATERLAGAHTVLLGGGPIDPGLRAAASSSGIRVVATYGSAETAGGCVYDGLPLDGVAVALAADGRIRIGGPTLFDGYLDDQALTDEVLVDGWFHTSDAGELDEDGRLRVLGRIDDMVISGGVKVPVTAVAARLRAHPDAGDVEVLGRPDPEWGQRVVAFVTGPLDLETARDWVASEHPRAWAPRQLIHLDEVPMLPNGKVDRQRLEALA
jgi:O-succinylbenzoic acid--CoA ligase